VALAADECRDARRLALVDTTGRDIVYALRIFRRAPLASLTIVATVALGLGLAASVFTFFNLLAFQVDAVRDPRELFAVERAAPASGPRRPFTRPDFEALRAGTNPFSEVAAMLSDLDTRIEGRMMSGTLVSGSFFRMLGVTAALGRTLSPADDDRAAPRPVLVLSHRGWLRRFAADPAIVGRIVTVNGAPHTIVGVMPEGFRGLNVGTAPDYWAPLSALARFRPIHAGNEDRVGIEIVGRLRPDLRPETAAAALARWADVSRPGALPPPAAPPPITLEPRQGTISAWGEMLPAFLPIFIAFGLILLIGCANVANLLLARGLARRRELGVRLALGASRGRLVRQLLTESLLLAAAAAVLGFVVSRVVVEAAVAAVLATAPEITESLSFSPPEADWRVVLFLILGAVASTVIFGLLPALQATRLALVRTMRGEVTRDGRPGRARHLLIGLQVTASALLLICAGVFLRSALRAAAYDPGLRTADVVLVDIVNEPPRAAMVAAVQAQPGVLAIAATSPELVSRPRAAFVSAAVSPAAAASVETMSRVPVAYRFVSPEFFAVLDIPIRRGRTFTTAESHGGSAVVVAESLARRLWPDRDAIAQLLEIEEDRGGVRRQAEEPQLRGRTLSVVGVARDVAGFRFAGYREAEIYLPTNASQPRTALIARVSGDPEAVRRALLDRLTAIDLNIGIVMSLRTVAGLETYVLQAAFWLAMVLGGVALVLTVSGLFSVLSYLVEQRTREIAVRIALGATRGQIAGVVLAQSSRPVLIGASIGSALAAMLALLVLSMEIAAMIGGSVRVFDPVAYAASLMVIVIACAAAAAFPAVRAARIDPMPTLRQD
jgi:predicted permease